MIWPAIFTSPVTLTFPKTLTLLLNVAWSVTVIGYVVNELIVLTEIFDVDRFPPAPRSKAIPFGLFVAFVVITW